MWAGNHFSLFIIQKACKVVKNRQNLLNFRMMKVEAVVPIETHAGGDEKQVIKFAWPNL